MKLIFFANHYSVRTHNVKKCDMQLNNNIFNSQKDENTAFRLTSLL